MLVTPPDFHCHAAASLDSASTPEAFAKRELELGTGSLTVTDHGTMAGCIKVYNIAKKSGLIPILGCEIYIRDDEDPILKKFGVEKDKNDTFASYAKYFHLTLHAKTQNAYHVLAKQLSIAGERAEKHGSERKPLMTWEQLEILGAEDITFGSGCLVGGVQRHLMLGRPDIAEAYYQKIRSIAKPGNFFVEVFPHACTHNWDKAVYITLEGGERLRYYHGKTLKTNAGEVTAEGMARAPAKHTTLHAIKNYRKWDEIEPKKIVEVKAVEGFIQNECGPDTPNGDVQYRGNQFVLEMARKYGDPVIVSNDSHFAYPDEHIVQDMRLMSSGGNWRMHQSYHRQSGAESFEFFKHSLGITEREFLGWVANAYEWADGFKDFEFKYEKSLPSKFYPEDSVGHLMTLIEKHGRMNWGDDTMVARLQAEVALLHNNGVIDLVPYFFVPEEAISYYAEKGNLSYPGRGSAAGMLISYLLNITQVDPLKYDLPMERFLTLDRVQSGTLPDIDMDFGDRDVITDPKTGWLQQRFGDHYCQISTDIVLKLKSAIKDVCRAKRKFVLPEIEDICKRLPNPGQGIDERDWVYGYTSEEGDEIPGLIDTEPALREYMAKYPEDWIVVERMLLLTRTKSRHPCGYVVMGDPVEDRIPTAFISDVKSTQYTADFVEQVGGVKYDFLSLTSLLDIQVALKLIQERSGLEIPESLLVEGRGNVPKARLLPFQGKLYDVWDLPQDVAVFNDIASGKTETVFQFDSNSARQWIHHFDYEKEPGVKALDSINALAAFTALDRPGPLDAMVGGENGHNMLVEYANRAKGLTPTEPIKAMDDLLPESLGVMVFQESLTRVYKFLTDCSGAEAEEFRRNIAKKKMEKVEAAYPNFIEKASLKVGMNDAQAIWDQIKTFGKYGFSINHAVPYVTVSYTCSFLKHYFPLEWWTAVLRNADKNEVGGKFWKHIGQRVLMPDLNLSGDNWTIEGDKIRAPLSFLSGIGPKASAELNEGRPYASLLDMAQKAEETKKRTSTTDANGKVKKGRSALNIGVISKLAISGALDSMMPANASDVEKIEAWLDAIREAAQKKTRDKFPEAYHVVGELARYQIRKEILPIYSGPLQEAVWREDQTGKITRRGEGPEYSYNFTPEGEPIRLVEADEFQFLEGISIGQPLTVAVVAFIQDKREFTYKGNNRAVALTLEINGETFEFVRWPSKRTGKVKLPDGVEKGAIIVTTLERWSDGRPFSLGSIHVVRTADGGTTEPEEESK